MCKRSSFISNIKYILLRLCSTLCYRDTQRSYKPSSGKMCFKQGSGSPRLSAQRLFWALVTSWIPPLPRKGDVSSAPEQNGIIFRRFTALVEASCNHDNWMTCCLWLMEDFLLSWSLWVTIKTRKPLWAQVCLSWHLTSSEFEARFLLTFKYCPIKHLLFFKLSSEVKWPKV